MIGRLFKVNRFTREARRCVEFAVEEAVELGHDSVGDEDLLLGVLRNGEGAGGEALRSLGVTRDAVRGEAMRLFADSLESVGVSLEEVRNQAGEAFEMRRASPGRLPFSPRAKKALEQSLTEALRLGDNEISGEHVLRGVLRVEHGTAVRILTNLGVPAETVEERLDELRR